MKDDQNSEPAEKIKGSGDKPKVRSLHRIDEEDAVDKTGPDKKITCGNTDVTHMKRYGSACPYGIYPAHKAVKEGV